MVRTWSDLGLGYAFGVVPSEDFDSVDVFEYDDRSFKLQAHVGTLSKPYEYYNATIKYETELSLVPCRPS